MLEDSRLNVLIVTSIAEESLDALQRGNGGKYLGKP